MKFEDLLYRSWFYFRTGYALYLAFLIGFLSNIVVIFKLAIEPIQQTCVPSTSCPLLAHVLKIVFPSLTAFAVIGTLVTFPVGVYAGHFHMKRTDAFAADASISTESNPYAYKAVPGKELEVFIPLMILTAKGLSKVMEEERILSPEEKQEFDKVLAKAETLLAGQVVGQTRTRGLLWTRRRS